jgi:hypothetical protein
MNTNNSSANVGPCVVLGRTEVPVVGAVSWRNMPLPATSDVGSLGLEVTRTPSMIAEQRMSTARSREQ